MAVLPAVPRLGYGLELTHDSFDRIKHMQAVPFKDRGAGEDIPAGDRARGPVLGL
jgi:hypothetical protein